MRTQLMAVAGAALLVLAGCGQKDAGTSAPASAAADAGSAAAAAPAAAVDTLGKI